MEETAARLCPQTLGSLYSCTRSVRSVQYISYFGSLGSYSSPQLAAPVDIAGTCAAVPTSRYSLAGTCTTLDLDLLVVHVGTRSS